MFGSLVADLVQCFYLKRVGLLKEHKNENIQCSIWCKQRKEAVKLVQLCSNHCVILK
jgi:hypothetical protein